VRWPWSKWASLIYICWMIIVQCSADGAQLLSAAFLRQFEERWMIIVQCSADGAQLLSAAFLRQFEERLRSHSSQTCIVSIWSSARSVSAAWKLFRVCL